MVKVLNYYLNTPPNYVLAWLARKGLKHDIDKQGTQYKELICLWYRSYEAARVTRRKRVCKGVNSSSNRK